MEVAENERGRSGICVEVSISLERNREYLGHACSEKGEVYIYERDFNYWRKFLERLEVPRWRVGPWMVGGAPQPLELKQGGQARGWETPMPSCGMWFATDSLTR